MTGIQETKGIARRAKDWEKDLYYIKKIRQELQQYLPVDYKELGLKDISDCGNCNIFFHGTYFRCV